MTEPIISVSGLRGVVGESLTPEVAIRYVAAFADQAPSGPILVTRDGRATGRMIADVVIGALRAMGRRVLDGDVAATPTTGVLTQQHQCAGGVQVSASHNPPQYNGLKLFSDQGRVISAAAGQKVIDAYRKGGFPWATHEAVGPVEPLNDTTSRHIELVLAIVDVQRIQARRFRVLLDANHGAGAVVGRPLLERLGCDVTVLGGEPNGRFAHPPEPTAEHLTDVCDRVAAADADIGFCQDPDADRLAVIDQRGRYLGEEYTLAIAVEHVLGQRPGPIVTNCSSSRMSEDVAQRHGAPFYRSAVGEANVTEMMLAHGAALGGEGNGGVIDPRVVYVRDSFVGMALLLDAMAVRGEPISRLADELPRYQIVKTKVSLAAERIEAAFATLAEHFSDAAADRMDGLRLDWADRWLLVRASNTEPIVRIIAEANTAEAARTMCDKAAAVVTSV